MLQIGSSFLGARTMTYETTQIRGADTENELGVITNLQSSTLLRPALHKESKKKKERMIKIWQECAIFHTR